MNYLAHLALAETTRDSLTGNLLGDFMRGVPIDDVNERLLKGLQQHRMVDRITDAHKGVSGLKAYLTPDKRRFSGIISDVVFDYFLIKHWSSFHDQPLDTFLDEVYPLLLSNTDNMPGRMAAVVTRICQEDWLRFYSTIDGVSTALDNMSRRIRFTNTMAGAKLDIYRNYEQFERVFLSLYPQLMLESAHFRNTS
ncbi:Acyl carrier protein phosphodiesterase [BD1-7 clade bacterium]|uniref:Acyl carrier protein phosphodiesterase n=1 Tax=BD1-7 clade bacterium TaxID=2029982 RepID=A0A5S9QQ83_9GAMM|nr:Acyl carrier protein phosphodiesterase [BD1-7 clade bacterium]CAA0120702.1 Acyl carrier protein phosphodiesterase [BD1-7 clade bacterium]